jgi:mono/diheme cytochrome c family protein
MHFITPCILFITVLSFNSLKAQQVFNGSYPKGRTLFFSKCANCHSVNKEILGPMLGSIPKKRSKEWLSAFIKNSQDVIVSGDEYANFLFEQYNHTVMPSFQELTETDIENLLTYIESESLNPKDEYVAYPTNPEDVPSVALGGKSLFDLHCSSCHYVNKEGYGPALGSVTKRRPKDWLLKFVHNSRDVINSGDPYAKFIYEQFDKKRMIPFNYLDDQSIESIFDYIAYSSSSAPQIAGVNGRKNLEGEGVMLYSSYEYPFHSPDQGGGLFYKLFLSVVVLGAGTIHGFVLYRIYRYLAK